MLYQLSYVRLEGAHDTTGPRVLRNGSSEGCPNGCLLTTICMKSDVRRAATARRSQEVSALGFTQLTRREEGQTMAEYAVILGVITPVLLLLFARCPTRSSPGSRLSSAS